MSQVTKKREFSKYLISITRSSVRLIKTPRNILIAAGRPATSFVLTLRLSDSHNSTVNFGGIWNRAFWSRRYNDTNHRKKSNAQHQEKENNYKLVWTIFDFQDFQKVFLASDNESPYLETISGRTQAPTARVYAIIWHAFVPGNFLLLWDMRK